MTTTYTYTAADGTPVDPVASVVNGVASVDIYLIVTEGLHDLRSLWARAGTAVSVDRLADVARHAIGATGLLTGTLATAADVVEATATATRFLPLAAAAGTIRGAKNLGSDLLLIDALAAETINGGTAAHEVRPGQVAKFQSDGAGSWVDITVTATAQAASLQKASNLSDVASAATSRTNLGLGTAATQASTAFDAAGAATAAQAASLQKTNNLSDVASTSTSRTNLGLGTAATLASSAVAQTANNLSDLASASTARTNLGLGASATMSTAQIAADSALTGAYAQLAPDWVTGRAYVLGELVVSSGTLYRTTTAHTSSGSFDATKFTAVSAGSSSSNPGGPTLRGTPTSGQHSSSSSYTVTLPTGLAVGDLVIVFIEDENAMSSVPSNWVRISNDFGSFIGGAILTRTADSTLVATPSVSISLQASGNGSWIAAAYQAGTWDGTSTALRFTEVADRTGATTETLLTPYANSSADLLLFGSAAQGTVNSIGFNLGSQVATVGLPGTNGAVLYRYTPTAPGGREFTAVATASPSVRQYVAALVVFGALTNP